MTRLVSAIAAIAVLAGAGEAARAQRGPLPPPLIKEGVTQKIATYRNYLTTVRDRAAALKKDGKTIDETVLTLQDELQGRYNRNQMASVIRAAYNEAQ